ncbi:hypothetical protein GGI17_004460 [Coemansia sp. S146]|nr:hypothetical protein GGI17_004460 [Coemansia sp. S146]
MNFGNVSQPSGSSSGFPCDDIAKLIRLRSAPTIRTTAIGGFNPAPVCQRTGPSLPTQPASYQPSLLTLQAPYQLGLPTLLAPYQPSNLLSPAFGQSGTWSVPAPVPAPVPSTGHNLCTYGWQQPPSFVQPPLSSIAYLLPTSLTPVSEEEEAPYTPPSNAPDIQSSDGANGTPAPSAKGASKVAPKGKLYGCRQCGKTFARPSGLKTHSYSHTGEKPHKCGYRGCGKGFTTNSNRVRHEKDIHNNMPPQSPRSGEPRQKNLNLVFRYYNPC